MSHGNLGKHGKFSFLCDLTSAQLFSVISVISV